MGGKSVAGLWRCVGDRDPDRQVHTQTPTPHHLATRLPAAAAPVSERGDQQHGGMEVYCSALLNQEKSLEELQRHLRTTEVCSRH